MCRLFLAGYLTFNVKMFKSLHDCCVVEHKTCNESYILVKLPDTSNDLHCIVLGKEVRTCDETMSYSFIIGNSLW